MSRNLLISSMFLMTLFFTDSAWAQGTTDGREPDSAAAPGGDSGPKGADAAAPAGDPGAAGSEAAASDSSASESDPEPTSSQSTGSRVQLKGLEQKVNELKEKIFRSKARLNLLKETVLHGVIAGSRAVIKHRNEMGSSFRLAKLVYSMDGAEIFAKSDDSGALDKKRELEVFNGSIVPGNHTVSVLMVFQGHGYGIFSYLKGYTFTVKSSHTFTSGEGRQTDLEVRAFEKGNITTELKDRPSVEFKVNLFSIGGKK